jgi:hypothetical protein
VRGRLNDGGDHRAEYSGMVNLFALPEQLGGMVAMFFARNGYRTAGDAAELLADSVVQVTALAKSNQDAWSETLLNPQAETDVDSLTATAESVLDVLSTAGARALDLRGLRPEHVQPEHLAMALRVTSRWKDEVPGWHDALSVAEVAARQNGDDPRDILFGLI